MDDESKPWPLTVAAVRDASAAAMTVGLALRKFAAALEAQDKGAVDEALAAAAPAIKRWDAAEGTFKQQLHAALHYFD